MQETVDGFMVNVTDGKAGEYLLRWEHGEGGGESIHSTSIRHLYHSK